MHDCDSEVACVKMKTKVAFVRAVERKNKTKILSVKFEFEKKCCENSTRMETKKKLKYWFETEVSVLS